jgi:hypothetical protein
VPAKKTPYRAGGVIVVDVESFRRMGSLTANGTAVPLFFT